MENVARFAIVISAIFLLIIFIETFIKIGESCTRLRKNKEIIKKLLLTNKRKIFLECLCKREEIIYRSYLLHNTLHFISNFLSLEYSMATTAALLITATDMFSKIWMPLITMTFTVVNICVKPQHRANQYLLAWRKYDTHTKLLLQKNYENMSEEAIFDEFEKSIRIQSKIESFLKHDETEND